MADPEDQYVPFCVATESKWFLGEKPTWDTKSKLVAEHMRTDYEFYMMSPQEKAKYIEDVDKLWEELPAEGKLVLDDSENEADASIIS